MSEHDFERFHRSTRYFAPAVNAAARLVIATPSPFKSLAKLPLKVMLAWTSLHFFAWRVINGL